MKTLERWLASTPGQRVRERRPGSLRTRLNEKHPGRRSADPLCPGVEIVVI
jgi:hypothetical protein